MGVLTQYEADQMADTTRAVEAHPKTGAAVMRAVRKVVPKPAKPNRP